jgi:prevent-host-death family protein
MASSRVLTIPATELKNKTGQAIRAAEEGRRVIVTRRGRPVAILIPAQPEQPEADQPPYEQAWREIEQALEHSPARHQTWREALDRSRRRG